MSVWGDVAAAVDELKDFELTDREVKLLALSMYPGQEFVPWMDIDEDHNHDESNVEWLRTFWERADAL